MEEEENIKAEAGMQVPEKPQNPDEVGSPPKRATQSSGSLFSDPSEALKSVRDDYLYWTGKLTESSFQLSLAIIAANWAVFTNKNDLLKNGWARASIAVVLLSLAVSLVAAKMMGEAHRKIIDHAESDLDRWKKEFDAALDTKDPWPFTQFINRYGRVARECKTWLPLAGGIFFLLALFFD